jgi:outer membrane receptor protein involved in Fe transport
MEVGLNSKQHRLNKSNCCTLRYKTRTKSTLIRLLIVSISLHFIDRLLLMTLAMNNNEMTTDLRYYSMKNSLHPLNKVIALTISFSPLTSFANTNEAIVEKSIESIQVIGKKHNTQISATQNSHIIDLNELSTATSSITDIITELPGLNVTGQGGLFQVYSIQGLSGARVQTQISGVPLYTERRAGTAASFVSPFLLGSIEVLKGASSTFYGSGAIGGIVQITPRHFERLALSSSFASADNERQYNIGWGNEDFSFAISHQKANNSKTVTGNALNSHYQQTSASFKTQWQLAPDINAQLLFLPSYGEDIGKANNDDFINKKYTVYPKESHFISQLALLGNDWQGNIALHQQQLDTSVKRIDKRVNTINSQATDYSANFSQKWEMNGFFGLWGIDQQFRGNVKADEKEQNLNDKKTKSGINLLAQQYDGALFSHASRTVDKITFNAGARVNYIKQENKQGADNNSLSAHAWTGFSNIDIDLTSDIKLNAAISRGFRFATLSERFYSGTTGRGQTIGNANLRPETATNYSLSLTYQQISFSLFSNKIKHYIERVNLDENTRTYKNVYHATINGAEFEFYQQLNDNLHIRFNGDYTQGKNKNGENLAGIANNKIQFIANYNEDNWSTQLKIKHRFAKNIVAQGEESLDTASVVSVHWLYELTNNWQLTLSAKNLFNEIYQMSTDKKSTLSSERQFAIQLNWPVH